MEALAPVVYIRIYASGTRGIPLSRYARSWSLGLFLSSLSAQRKYSQPKNEDVSFPRLNSRRKQIGPHTPLEENIVTAEQLALFEQFRSLKYPQCDIVT